MRISGITIPNNKRLEIGLTTIYGIGLSTARDILDKVKVEYSAKAETISPEIENEIRKIIDLIKTEGNLKREVASNIKRLKDIKSYRGTRHIKRLPVNGQRTKTNSRTIRGNVRKTMASGRKIASKT